ncbi:MAG: hypothetical protein AABZ80_08785 [Gemmatimonadota bacterium]
MRVTIKLATVVLALSAAACAPSAKTGTAADGFKRDLALASATNLDLATPVVNTALLTKLETAPSAAMPARTIKKAESGDLAVKSEAPTVQAELEPEPAPVEEAQPVATAPAPAPVPPETNEPVAVAPRPMPAPVTPAGGIGAGDYGRGGGVFGGGIGVVIRGGGVGGDNCEIHNRRRGGVIYRSPVYAPRPLSPAPSPERTVNPRGIRVAIGGVR